MERLSLRHALDHIYSAESVPTADRRRLATRAIAFAMHYEGIVMQEPQVTQGPIATLQLALDQVKRSARAKHMQVPNNITMAKSLLRTSGASSLASRLSKASKVRNGSAHPDLSLVEDIAKFFAEGKNGVEAADLISNTSHDYPVGETYGTKGSNIVTASSDESSKEVDPKQDKQRRRAGRARAILSRTSSNPPLSTTRVGAFS